MATTGLGGTHYSSLLVFKVRKHRHNLTLHCKPPAALNDRKVTILDRHFYLLGVVYFWGYVQLAAAACWQAT